MSIASTGDRGRRAFIKTVVLSTGAVFLDWNVRADAEPAGQKVVTGALDYKLAHEYLRDKKKTITPVAPKDVADYIVIGGGLSGLAAAWNFRHHGKTSLVLDNEPAAGGAVRRDSATGADIGAVRFANNGGKFAAMFKDCGLQPVRLPDDGYWINQSTTLHNLYSEKTLRENPIAAGSPNNMRRFRNAALAIDPKPQYPLHAMDPAMVNEYDAMEGTQVISSYQGVELADWLDVYSMGMFGKTLDKLNAYLFYSSYMQQFGEDFDSSWYSFPGGMNDLPAALMKSVGPSNVRSNTLVLRVENTPTAVLVTVLGPNGVETLRARAAVVAVQKRIAQHIVADIPELQAYRMKNLNLAPSVTVQLRCSAPITKTRSFMLWFRDAERRFTRLHDATYLRDMAAGTLDRTTGEFIYTLPCIPTDTGMASLEKEEWLVNFAQMTLGALGQYLPKAMEVTTELRIFAWGHAIVSPLPGTISQLYPGIAEPFDKIFFGAADNDIASTVEGALANGMHAAELAMNVK